MATRAKTNKNDRLDLRIETSQKKFLRYVAKLHKMELTAFVLSSALRAAEKIIEKKVHFQLPEKQWKDFCKTLDRPARKIPGLLKLFSEPDVFK